MTMARYSGVVQDQAGNIITNAKIEVRRESPGQPLAAIKSDREGLSALANPFNANADGTFAFHVVGGAYKIRAYVGSSSNPTFEEVRRYEPVGLLQEYDIDAVLIGKRQQVRVATTSNITISTALNNGDTIDGVTLATNDLVLVKDQTSKQQNGVYVVGAVPARAAAFDTYDEHAGAMIAVVAGTAGAGSVWFCTANAGGTLDTTAIDFTKLAATAGPAGDPGEPGEPGPPGPATIAIGGVTTLAPGQDATVTNSGDDENVILNFGIPVGAQGEQGIQGAQGPQGLPGADGADGADGSNGADGNDGWSPVFSVENDSARRVLRVVDWVGGEGTKPATGKYVGATGLETLIANGVDIRGPQGAAGAGSGDMQAATYDPNGDGKFANAQLDDMAQGTLKGRRAGAGSGAPTDITLANLKVDLSLNNVTNVAQLPASYLDPDATLAANSDTKVATQKAVKSYVDSIADALDLMQLKTVLDCSANPNYPAANKGWAYPVSVAGKIGGAAGKDVEVGDWAICFVDGSASGNQAAVGANWYIWQANIFTTSAGLAMLGAANAAAQMALLAGTTPTWTGLHTFTANIALTQATASIEIGQVGAANTPYIDFHSAAFSNDYDVRIMASGGASGVGTGGLTFTGGAFVFLGQAYTPVATITDGANLSWVATQAQKAKVTLGGNRTMLAVGGVVEGATYFLWVIQDSTGSRTITWTTSGAGSFDFGTDGAPTLTTTANRADLLCFEAMAIGGTLKLRFAGIKKGFA